MRYRTWFLAENGVYCIMNLRNDFTSPSDNNDEKPKYADEMMTLCMAEIHDILMEPMSGKLSAEQSSILSLIGITLKIIAAKATQLEKMENDNQTSGDEWKN